VDLTVPDGNHACAAKRFGHDAAIIGLVGASVEKEQTHAGE
jgi:hypothetical protein